MRIVDRKFVDKNIHTTRTRQHFGALLGEKPHVMGQVVRMYPRLTISNLTEGLRNVYTNKKSEGQFTNQLLCNPMENRCELQKS
jgi:hypothetical protein